MFPRKLTVLNRNCSTPYYNLMKDCRYNGEHPKSCPVEVRRADSPKEAGLEPGAASGDAVAAV